MIRTIPTLHSSALAVSALIIAASTFAWLEATERCRPHAPAHTAPITRAAQ